MHIDDIPHLNINNLKPFKTDTMYLDKYNFKTHFYFLNFNCNVLEQFTSFLFINVSS